MSIDFAGINAGLLARAREFLLEIFPAGTIEGHEFKLGDIDGSPGRSMSINMRTGVGSDFASGETWGDLIAVYAAHRRIPMGEAAKELGGDRYKSNGSHARPAPAPKDDKPAKDAIIPVPADAPAPPGALRLKRRIDGKDVWIERPVVAKWAYHTAEGGLIGYACRIEFEPDESGEVEKDVIPIIYAHDAKQGRDRWMQGAFPKPRPLYGLPAVVQNDGASILLVEGEKCVDYARALGIKRIATTWPGGGRAVKHVDLSPLAGRDVLLFPDHDEPGREAMAAMAQRLLMLKCTVSVIDTQADDLPEGWDIADSGFDKKQFNEWARSRIHAIGQGKAPATPQAQRGAPRTDPRETTVVSASGGIVLGEEQSAFVNWAALALDLDTKQQPYPNTSNLIAILTRHPRIKGRIWYDEFYNRIYHTLLTDDPQEMADHMDIELTAWMQSVMKMPKVTKGCVRDAVTSVAMRDVRNAPKEWAQSLVWDETERLPLMFCDGWGVPATSYTTSISRCFMVGMMARLMQPGCQLDYLPVFESTEGKNKSKALRALGGIWHTEMHEEIGGKDFYQGLTGKLIVEFSEMHSIAGRDVRRIKGILSNPVDRYRESYGHRPADHRRRCVFVATTNPEDWNESDTGARRFWPLACGEVNVDYIHANRDQLFAEALVRYRRGESWWDFDTEAAGDEQEARRVADPWTDSVTGFAQFASKLTIESILEDALRLPVEQRNMVSAKRVGRILRSAGYVKRVSREGSKMFKRWVLP